MFLLSSYLLDSLHYNDLQVFIFVCVNIYYPLPRGIFRVSYRSGWSILDHSQQQFNKIKKTRFVKVFICAISELGTFVPSSNLLLRTKYYNDHMVKVVEKKCLLFRQQFYTNAYINILNDYVHDIYFYLPPILN